MTVVEGWLGRAARSRPDREAVNGVAYAVLRLRACAGARDLVGRGVRPGVRVGLALPAGIEWVVALHATWVAGGVVVPVDPRDPAPPAVDVLVSEPLGDGPPAAPDPGHDLADVAVVIHTSGSTGVPKPVGLTFGNLLWSALGSGVALGVDPAERWLCPLPVTHVGGVSIVVRSAIYATTARVLERWDTDQVLGELRGGATLVSLVPTTLRRLLAAGLTPDDVPALRTVLLGGAPIPPELVDGAGVPVTGTYGLTEACSQVTTGGPPLFCTRVRIADDGEIVVAGPTVAPQVGEELFTGDLGRLDDEGALHVVGRKADTIVTGAENVAPAEVEAVLQAHGGVREAAVLGVPDPEWGERVVALVVGDASEDELRAHARAALAPFQAPKEVRRVAALPRTASGKLRRAELTGLWAANAPR